MSPVCTRALTEAQLIRYIILYRPSGASPCASSSPPGTSSPSRSSAPTPPKSSSKSGAPVFLTQHGRGTAVLLDVESYEALVDELELLRDVRNAEAQVAAGKGRSHAAVAKALRARLAK